MPHNVITCDKNYIPKLCYLLVFLEVPYKADLEPWVLCFCQGSPAVSGSEWRSCLKSKSGDVFCGDSFSCKNSSIR